MVIFNDGLPRRAYGPGRFRLWGRGLTEQRFRTEEILLKALPEVRAILPKQWYAEANLGAEQRGVIFLEGVPVGVKDIVLPGEMKVILNRVIEAEKEALANVILRREEVAATRSLANTARVLADNPVLLRLKEFDALKEITAKIGEVKVVVGADNPSAPLNVRRFKAPRTLWPFATFALAALLMLSNAAWAYHVLDASVTNTYREQTTRETCLALKQALDVFPRLAPQLTLDDLHTLALLVVLATTDHDHNFA